MLEGAEAGCLLSSAPCGQPGKLLSPPGQHPCKVRAAFRGGSQLTEASFCLCRGSGAAREAAQTRSPPCRLPLALD